MPSAVDRLFVELQRFFQPLGVAISSPGELAAFLRGFGFAFDRADVTGAAGQLAPTRAAMLKLVATIREAVDKGLDAGSLADIAVAAEPVFQGLDSFPDAVSALAPPGPLSPADFAQSLKRLPEEVFNVLLTDYLADHVPLLLHALVFLDVVRASHIPETGDPRSRGIEYSIPEYRWDRLRLLVEDASKWAEQAYGWGVAFDSDTFIFRFARIFEYLGGIAEIREMSEGQATVLMPHLASSPAQTELCAGAPCQNQLDQDVGCGRVRRGERDGPRGASRRGTDQPERRRHRHRALHGRLHRANVPPERGPRARPLRRHRRCRRSRIQLPSQRSEPRRRAGRRCLRRHRLWHGASLRSQRDGDPRRPAAWHSPADRGRRGRSHR